LNGSRLIERLDVRVYVTQVGHLNIRDLQKISADAISALPGATAISLGRGPSVC
jgi:hypothetical protein